MKISSVVVLVILLLAVVCAGPAAPSAPVAGEAVAALGKSGKQKAAGKRGKRKKAGKGKRKAGKRAKGKRAKPKKPRKRVCRTRTTAACSYLVHYRTLTEGTATYRQTDQLGGVARGSWSYSGLTGHGQVSRRFDPLNPTRHSGPEQYEIVADGFGPATTGETARLIPQNESCSGWRETVTQIGQRSTSSWLLWRLDPASGQPDGTASLGIQLRQPYQADARRVHTGQTCKAPDGTVFQAIAPIDETTRAPNIPNCQAPAGEVQTTSHLSAPIAWGKDFTATGSCTTTWRSRHDARNTSTVTHTWTITFTACPRADQGCLN
jgi:hypothetical protein